MLREFVYIKKKKKKKRKEKNQRNLHLEEFFYIQGNFSWSERKLFQKQPFADVLKIRCSSKFLMIHRKAAMSESLY